MAKVTVRQSGRSRRPELREVAVAQVHDKYSGYPSNGLTPTRLAEIFREADSGDVLRQMELFEEFEEKDPHLFSQLQTRKNAVTGLDYEIVPFDADDDRDKEIAKFVEAEISALEGFEDIQMDLLDAIGKGFSVSEIMWGYDENRTVIKEIKSLYQKRFFWDTLDDSFKIRTQESPQGILLPENKFIVHRYKARSGHPSRAGVLRVVAWMYLFKNYDLKDWLSFCEVYGMPLRLGKYPTGASEPDKLALKQALVQIGADAAGIIPDGTSIDFITTEKASSTDLFERLARFCDEQISKAVLGQTLTSDSGGGSFAQSKTHNEVRHDLTVADCKALAGTLRRDLVRPLVMYNFGEDKRIPYIRYDCEEAGDLEQTAKIIGTLIKDTGLKVSTGYLYKKFSIPKPEANDEIAQPSQQSLPFATNSLTAPSPAVSPGGTGMTSKEVVTGDAQEVKVASEVSLNGSQISSLIQIVQEANAGMLSRESAMEIITSSFPFDRAKAEAILGPALGRGTRQLSLKASNTVQAEQQDIDHLADAAVEKSGGVFEKMCGPLYEIVNNAGSMDDIAAIFSNSERAAGIAAKMGGADVEELLAKAMFLADLKGRMLEYG